MELGWIWTKNLRPFLELVAQVNGHRLTDNDWDLCTHGVVGTDSERGPWFEYRLAEAAIIVRLAHEPHAARLTNVKLEAVPEAARSAVALVTEIARQYQLSGAKLPSA